MKKHVVGYMTIGLLTIGNGGAGSAGIETWKDFTP